MSNMNNGASTLKRERDLRGAVLLDDNDRFYLEGERGREYGYQTHLTGSYVCYTCGHLCECGEDSDYVDTISWSSSNPTGEVR